MLPAKTFQMNDREIIQGLIGRDSRITYQFFYVKCKPLLTAIMRLVFSYPVEYNEMVSELYGYMMANDCAKLRQFQYRSSIYQWMKIVATRFFIRHRNSLIENASREAQYETCEETELLDAEKTVALHLDVETLLSLIANKRYADAIRALVLEETPPEKYAAQIGVTVENLYNIKKRAMAALTKVAIKHYGYEL